MHLFTLSLRQSGTCTLVLLLSTLFEPRSVNWGRSAWRRMERSSQDGTLNGGKNAQQRTERSSQDGTLNGGRGALLKTELSTEEGELDAGRNVQRRTVWLAEDGALAAGLETRWKTERYSQDLEHLTLFSVRSHWTIDAILCPLSLNAQNSSLFFVAKRSMLSYVRFPCANVDHISHKPMLTNWRSQTNVHKPTLTNQCSWADTYLIFSG